MLKKIGTVFLFVTIACFACEICGFTNDASDKISHHQKPRKKKIKYVKSKDAVKTLIAFAKSRGDMIKELNAETENYESMDKAITDDVLLKGESADLIEKKYGKPVITLTKPGEKQIEWVYKKADDSYFTGSKIRLFFDEEKKLLSWEKTEETVCRTETK
ncbi:MAG: hypothetical protein ABIH85_00070 [Candidatus Omnitrophota bacterium]|nr:hypothetical protein [Candidatus Omnitrophota bacterium]MBU1895241.1 hypothetical protein [Candidatus Omnitrophota bacterium]